MKLHLVGGFLGSGKTTAIIHAARALMAQGQTVGVITNDQGKYLVDSAFFRLDAMPTVEVSGGCFCCNYDDLDDRLGQLIASAHPDVIFAESVGSCADVVATVVRPLLELGLRGGAVSMQPASFSVFSDARLLRRRLLGLEMPFSEDVVYIFDKQIEEDGLLVVNKIDLLAASALEELRGLVAASFPGKPARFQTSLTSAGVQGWLDAIQTDGLALPDADAALEIDYARYGAGEARLAWLDASITLNAPTGAGRAVVRELIAGLAHAIRARGAGIGHLKCIVAGAKISVPALEEPGWEAQVPEIAGGAVDLLVNARVELDAGVLREIFYAELARSGVQYQVNAESAFHPGMPRPVHRIG